MIYCPKCLDTSINLELSGVVHFIINGRHQETSQLLFSVDDFDQEKFAKEFRVKISEFMVWYSQFKNREVISSIQVFTNNYRCNNGCAFSANLKFSVVEVLLSANQIVNIVRECGREYGIETKISSEDIVV